VTHCCCHFSYLPVTAFRQCYLQPRCGDVLPEPDRTCSWWQFRLSFERLNRRFLCFLPLDHHARFQFRECFSCRDPLNLHEILSRVAMVRFKQAVFGIIVVCEEQEPFTVSVQSADRINISGKRAEITQSLSPSRITELGKDPVWFMKDDVRVSFRGLLSVWHDSIREKKSPGRNRGIVFYASSKKL
jgi:hypothetical protein